MPNPFVARAVFVFCEADVCRATLVTWMDDCGRVDIPDTPAGWSVPCEPVDPLYPMGPQRVIGAKCPAHSGIIDPITPGNPEYIYK